MVNSKELASTTEYTTLQMRCCTTNVITGFDYIL